MTKATPDNQAADSNSRDLHAERTTYEQDELHRKDLVDDPIILFGQWLQLARDKKIIDATAMTLATATSSGIPSARTVLLKQFGDTGFYWYTSYESRKGNELAENPNAALLFYWRDLERQVRIEGAVKKIDAVESDKYFASRPDGSKYSAIASPQSRVVPSQAWLQEAKNKLAAEFTPEQLNRPAHWGGYSLYATQMEFWQGRPDRSHDRFLYTRAEGSQWQIDRLAP